MSNENKTALPGNKRLSPLVPLFLFFVFILAACASREPAEPSTKSGMHFDAVLEFVVEYPLGWAKDRRIQFGNSHGEVRWTAPDNASTKLRLFSYLPEPEAETPSEILSNALPEHPELQITSEEQKKLPAGESIHLIAKTEKANIEIYLLMSHKRHYMILLSTSGDIQEYAEILSVAVQSFNIVK